jgi:hypothetical protein
MNKKLNSILFILAATVANVIIIGLLIIIPTVLLALLLGENFSSISWALFAFLPIAAIVGGFFIYTKLYTILQKKVNIEKYLEPIFKRKR